jgi:PAS domain S-box-containing protein
MTDETIGAHRRRGARVTETGSHEEPRSGPAELRSVAQLRMLHSLAPRLNLLNDPEAIGGAITAELKTLIDYHNCRIYLLQDDGVTLWPIVFRGELTEYEGETYEELVTKVGEGITGHAAETRETFYTPNALEADVGVQIEGTAEIVESILAVPMLSGDRLVGVIVLSNLGEDQFAPDDQRVLEVLASHGATAFENARLLRKEREAAETASALLGLSQVLTGAHDVETVLARVVAAVPSIIDCGNVGIYVRDPELGTFRRAALSSGTTPGPAEIDAETAEAIVRSSEETFVLSEEAMTQLPPSWAVDPYEVMASPLRWDPDGFALLIVQVPGPARTFSQRDLALGRGIADIASLALGSARRFHELERFQELVDSLEATFWEADPDDLTFTFLSRRAALVFGSPEGAEAALRTWGEQIHPDDREASLAALRAAVTTGGDHNLEYRAFGREGEPIWLRDLIHVVRRGSRVEPLRGLIVDITQRKHAEQALRRSERKYSEAFRREREATQRLRALDEMKNTFLEAVSHDLRTPLTSILGSALTLEQNGMDIPRDDAEDLLRRIASNARKLERLLSDLLDLDRLQRGIISPQRRPTDMVVLIEQAVHEADLLGGRDVHVDVEPGLVVNVDAAKVERIVENLLANAARHTPKGSSVWVTARRRDRGLLLSVDDEGAGVPIEMREAIFEPFRQAGPANPSPGVGVGLSLVARFAELHGGAAWVEDRPAGGSSFRVYLPES